MLACECVSIIAALGAWADCVMVGPGGVSAANNFNGLFVKKPFVALLMRKDIFG